MAEAANRALIVGITGQDGALLAELLLGKGYEVTGTTRDPRPEKLAHLERLGLLDRLRIETLDPSDSRQVEGLLGRVNPGEVYNVSGQSSVAASFERPRETLQSIVDVTAALLHAIGHRDGAIRFFSAGSSECFGDVAGAIADEGTPFQPVNPYGEAKAAAHAMVADHRETHGMHASTGVLFNHESALRPERFVTRKIASAAARIASGSAGKLMLGNMDIRRDWGWAPEYVEAMWRMLRQDAPGDYVIATGKLASLEDFVASAFAAVGLDWREHVATDPALMRPADPRGFAGNPERARQALGWRATIVMPEVAERMVSAEVEKLASKPPGPR